GAQPGEGVIRSAEGSFVISADGTTLVTFHATDAADNREVDRSVEVTIDRSAPVTRPSVSPAANADGWNRDDVVVHLEATDAGGGVEEIRYRVNDGPEQ